MRFCIWIVDKKTLWGVPGYLVWLDLAQALRESLRTLGHEVADLYIGTAPPMPTGSRGRLLILGGHWLGTDDVPFYNLPEDAIFYDLEQPNEPGERPSLEHLCKPYFAAHELWEFSPGSVEQLRQRRPRVRLCRVGDAPSLRASGLQERWRAIADADKACDVLFYGALLPRREQLLQALQARGVRVQAQFALWGPERDAAIAGARLVLNLHAYDRNGILEMARVSYLLANAIPVVSETGVDTDLEAELVGGSAQGPGIILSPYERLAQTIVELLAQGPAARAALGLRGQQVLRELPQVAEIARALAESQADEQRLVAAGCP